MVDKTTKEMWLTIFIVADDLTRIGKTHSEFLTESNLSGNFKQVTCVEKDSEGRPLLCFEQNTPKIVQSTKYANSLQELFDTVKQDLWTTVSSFPPYRRYYVYLRPSTEAAQYRKCHLHAVYYPGSITRYRPHHYHQLLTTTMAMGKTSSLTTSFCI